MTSAKFEYFVLFADMRTGSNLFEESINGFDSLECHGEIFNPKFVGFPLKDSILNLSVKERNRDPFAALAKLIGVSNGVMSGFRLFSNHDQRIIDFCLQDESCAKIVLTRNPLESFISKEIAVATDQWKLKDAHLRRKAMIEFKIEKFEKFLSDRLEFQKKITKGLHQSGQTAFYIDYEDLLHDDIYNGLANYLGVQEKFKPLKRKMARQNPEDISDKVANFDEMIEQIKELNLFDAKGIKYVEPRHDPTRDRIEVFENHPIMYLPVSESDNDAMKQRLRAIGGPSRKRLSDNQIVNWFGDHQKTVVLTYVEHPLERAYNAFNKAIVMRGFKGMNWIRKLLIEHYDLDLIADGFRTKQNILEFGYTAEQHQNNFEKFLPYLKRNLHGQTRANVSDVWASQHARIESYQKWAIPHYIATSETIDDVLNLVAKSNGIKTSKNLSKKKSDFPFELDTVFTPEMNKLVRQAYPRDFELFSFEDYKPKS